MRKLVGVILILPLLAAGGQYTIPSATGANRSATPPPSCGSPPTVDVRLRVWAASSTCGGGSACTNGAGLDTIVDTGAWASRNATQTNAPDRPIYTTSAINTLAAANWNGSSTQMGYGAIGPNGTMTWFAVFKTTAGGAFTGNGASGTFEWRIATNGKQEILKARISSIASSTSTIYMDGNWHAALVTYNQPTGAYAFYNCTSGTCNLDGSGTSGIAFSSNLDTLGYQNGDGPFSGFIAEVNYTGAISTTGYGTYAQACYGL